MMRSCLFALVAFGAAFAAGSAATASNCTIPPEDYNKRELPPQDPPDRPVEVNLTFNDVGLEKVNDVTRTYEIVLSFDADWIDARLANNRTGNDCNESKEHQVDDPSRLWRPDLYISRNKEFKVIKVIEEAMDMFVNVTNGATSWWFEMYTEVECNFDFSKYPLDKQTCYFNVSSRSHYADEQAFAGRIKRQRRSTRLQYDYEIELHYLESDIVDVFSHGNYSQSGFTIHLSRKFYPFLVNDYLPSLLLVMVSWMSFCIPVARGMDTERMALLVTVLLMVVNQSGDSREKEGIVFENITALDVWLIACMLCTTVAQVQYAVLLCLWFRYEKRASRRARNLKSRVKMQYKEEKARLTFHLLDKIDFMSCTVVIALWLIFIAGYLAHYLG